MEKKTNEKESDKSYRIKGSKEADLPEKFYPFSHDLVFACVLSSHPELAKELIELILGIQIDHVEIAEAQKTINYVFDSKSIRLDVYLKNDQDIFDVEMQTSKVNRLDKRMRYYQAANACEDLERGDNYDKLRNCYVIFICADDPFQKGDAIYRFQMRSDRYDDIQYDDGAYNVVLNTSSKETDIPIQLRNFMNYIKTGTAVDNFTTKIQNEVKQINSDRQWRKSVMTLEEKIRIESKEAFAEGRLQGISEGKEEGRKEGEEEGKKKTVFQTVKRLIEEGKFSTEEEACEFLGYDISEYRAAKESFN